MTVAPALKTMPWPVIAEQYRAFSEDPRAAPHGGALQAIAALAVSISEGPLSSALFGWTSMFDLCIQQTDAVPRSGPYLKVSPLSAEVVEFRYIDTAIPDRQWHRTVPPEAVEPRFQAFLDQLHWFA